MVTLSAAPTRHHHNELFSEILLNQYLPGPELKREGWLGKKKTALKWQANNKALANSRGKELQASNCVYQS